MKKLMIALAAAAAITGVAKAETGPGVGYTTTFENLNVGASFSAASDDTDTHGTSYWAIEADPTEPYAIVTNSNFNGTAPEALGDKSLTIDTDKLLSRKVNPDNQGAAVPESFETAPLYFDGYVQFTAADSLPETEAGDKLVVWLYGGDADTDAATATALGLEDKVATNLVVTAGKIVEGILTTKQYVITNLGNDEAEIAPNSWHRLTIKAIVDNNIPKFKVFVDGKLAKAGADEVYTSMVANGAAAWNTLTSVSFKGTGAVDELGFTNEDLFPEAAAETFTLTVTAATADLQGLVVSKDEESEIGIDAEADGTYKVPMDLGTVYVYFPSIAEGTITSATFGNQAVVIPAYASGYTFALTIPQGASGTTLGFAVTTSGGGSSDYPSYIDGIEDATTKAAYQTKYNAWKDTYGADAQSSYQSQFLLNIAPDQEAELTTAAIVVENGVVKITTSPAAGNVNGKVYIKKAETVQGLANTAWTEAAVSASGDDVGKVTDTAGDAGFYQIKVDF